jgi:putative transposase
MDKYFSLPRFAKNIFMGLRGRSKLLDHHCFFVTTTCHNFLPLLATETSKDILYDALKFVNEKYSCEIISYVWMPNHIHFICYFNKENKLIEHMRDFKKYTSVKIRDQIFESDDQELIAAIQYSHRNQKIKIWKDRFDDLYLFKGKTVLQKLKYIHDNPVKKGLCTAPWEYADSSAAFYINGEVPKIPILHCSEIL